MKLKKAFPLTFFLLLLVTFAYATGSKDALLYESFEAEWNTSSPWGPVGWSESAVASGTVIGDSDWDRDDNSNAIEGEYIAYMSQTSDPTDDWLITPVIDLTSNAGTDYLEYFIRIRYGLTAGDYLYIMISTDGGTSWSILKTYDSTNTDELSDYPLTRQVVDLTAYNDQSNVKLGFYGDYNDAYKLKLYLDCVKVDVYTAPDPVTTPDPEDAATGVAPDYTLGWAVSAMATSYDVYLGTDQTAVTNATNASPEFKGNQAGTTYTPSSNFDYNTQYFWRIDAVNDYGTGAGSVWLFITVPDPDYGGGNAGTVYGGYYYANSQAAGAPSHPSYNWVDITDGQEVYASLTGRDGYAPGDGIGYDIGFSFPFYGTNYTKFWIAADGFISLGTDHDEWANQNIPDVETPNALIALLWTDLNPSTAHWDTKLYYKNVGNKLIVTFDHFEWSWTSNADTWFTAQVILFQNGQIKFQYKEKGSSFESINDYTVGIENADGTKAVNYRYVDNSAVTGGPIFPTAKENEIAVMFGTDENTLPVELNSFTAVYASENSGFEYISVNWETASEQDVIGFNIYRSIENNLGNSTTVNQDLITGAGTSTVPHDYSFADITADVYTQYYYWLEEVSYTQNHFYGSFLYAPEEENPHPNDILTTLLYPNYPNPVKNNTIIKYQIQGSIDTQDAVIDIYNLKGELVKSIVGSNREATLDVSDMENGVYFYQMENDYYSDIHKMVILK